MLAVGSLGQNVLSIAGGKERLVVIMQCVLFSFFLWYGQERSVARPDTKQHSSMDIVRRRRGYHFAGAGHSWRGEGPGWPS